MHTLFLLNPTAGKADCTRALPRQIDAAAARAGLARGEYHFRKYVIRQILHADMAAMSTSFSCKISGIWMN